MEKVFKIAELISTDVRSRSNAGILQAAIDGVKETIVLDFAGVTFISRSFTDELCAILESLNNVRLNNTSDFVQSMIDVVCEGRKKQRVRITDNSEIKEFHDVESLSSFLETI
ncbi:hypothetical protein [Parabacteroides goldsteinii]|uniref:hypothetical protein n=1 Tax=Parabacteroides goldsteinii TaxID=328812 RepID=UPI002674E70B|nr:hypothetical protein [Parabacteroides goldsteinii]